MKGGYGREKLQKGGDGIGEIEGQGRRGWPSFTEGGSRSNFLVVIL